jgi:long-subunit acyl-CoA synthetase (AMP-forming)
VWNDFRFQFEQELKNRLKQLPQEETSNEEIYKFIRQDLLRKYQFRLGGRIKTIGIGGAVTRSSLVDWLREVFPRAFVSESYGTTEVSNIALNNQISPYADIKLLDWEVSRFKFVLFEFCFD